MKQPENCKIEYCGYTKPHNPDEIKFEILGLETAIFIAKKRIADLKQSEFLAQKIFSQQVQDILDEEEDDDYNSSLQKI